MGTDPTFSGVPGGDHRMYNAETGKFEVMTPTPLPDPTGPAGYAAPVTPVQSQELGGLLGDYGPTQPPLTDINSVLNNYGWGMFLGSTAPLLPGASPYSGSYFTLPVGSTSGGFGINNGSMPAAGVGLF